VTDRQGCEGDAEAGVKHLLWLTLHGVNKQYRLINEVIDGASARYDWMTVLDWNSNSRNLNLVVRDGQHPPRWPGRGPARDLHPPRSEAAGTDRPRPAQIA